MLCAIMMLAIMSVAVPTCGGDPAGVSETELVGTWSLGDNPQVWGVIAGSMVFDTGGTFIMSGPATTHEITTQGMWLRTGGMVTLTVDQATSIWYIEPHREHVRFLEVGGMTRWFSIFKPGPD